jgi:uncharacterized protein GlcG (DUF336 family)
MTDDPEPIDVIARGAKLEVNVMPERNNATLTVMQADGQPVLFVDMDGATLRQLSKDLAAAVAKFYTTSRKPRTKEVADQLVAAVKASRNMTAH